MRRRQVLQGGAALAGSGLLRPAFAANPAKTIRFVPQADLSSIDPVWTTATVAFNHGMMVYDSLYGIDASLTPKPQMVQGHEISDDKLTWTFTLRDGLLFHDDKPVRSIDCVASIKRSAEVDPFKQISDTTGSGPFRFLPSERVSGSFYAYERFDKYVPRSEPPSYWSGSKQVYVDRVEWRVIPDFAAAANAVTQGEVDWVESPLFDLLPMLRAAPDVRVVAIDPLFAPAVIALNHTQPPFDNDKVRKAILMVIDQKEFMTAVVGDQTNLMDVPMGIFTPHTPMANDTDMQDFTSKRDVEAAKRMVAESGYKGEKVVLMSPSDQPALVPMVQVTQSVFQEIGLNVDFQSMDWGTLVGRRASDKPSADGGWNSFCTSWNGITMSNPGSHFPLRGNGKSGWFGWPVSPVLEGLRDQWFAAADEAAQKAISDKMQAVAFEEVPYVPIGSYQLSSALRRSITDEVHAGNTSFWGAKKSA